MPQIWLIVGASRGIGLEFVTQLLTRGDTVIASVRAPVTTTPNAERGNASKLWSLTGAVNGQNLVILECDVSDEASIKLFTEQVRKLGRKGAVLAKGVIDVVVLNAGVLVYPNRVSEITFAAFAHHLHTNTIGPLITAQNLLKLSSPSPASIAGRSPTWEPAIPIQIRTLVFISSDSGSTTNFRSFEDGFGAYAASKAALNQGLRNLAAEMHRRIQSEGGGKDKETIVLAVHPGEVSTDMANIDLGWEVEGIITPQESIKCMLKVVNEKGWGGVDEGGKMTIEKKRTKEDEGAATFWTWEGKSYPW